MVGILTLGDISGSASSDQSVAPPSTHSRNRHVRHYDQKSRSGFFTQRGNGSEYLVAGKRVSMRLCDLEPGREVKLSTRRDYETVGYVISGSARLELEGQTLLLKQGDSWLVPAGAVHWNAIEHFKAIEATSPPAQVHGRDAYGYVEES